MGPRRGPGASGGRRSIGIMGGTFDPIHIGHLVTAEVARHAFQLERVVFLPSGHPPHKPNRTIADNDHRYLMVVLATIDNERFCVSRTELERAGKSYTIDTVREFRRQYGPAVDIWFITGADAIMEILSWKQPSDLLAQCQFIAATRPGYVLGQLERVVSALGPTAADRIHPLQVPALAISSSDIRRRVAGGEPIRYLVPSAVDNYIHQHCLYRDCTPGRGAESG